MNKIDMSSRVRSSDDVHIDIWFFMYKYTTKDTDFINLVRNWSSNVR